MSWKPILQWWVSWQVQYPNHTTFTPREAVIVEHPFVFIKRMRAKYGQHNAVLTNMRGINKGEYHLHPDHARIDH